MGNPLRPTESRISQENPGDSFYPAADDGSLSSSLGQCVSPQTGGASDLSSSEYHENYSRADKYIRWVKRSIERGRKLKREVPFFRDGVEEIWQKKMAEADEKIALAKLRLYRNNNPQGALTHLKEALRSSQEGMEVIQEANEDALNKSMWDSFNTLGFILGTSTAITGAMAVGGLAIATAPVTVPVALVAKAAVLGGLIGSYLAGMIHAEARSLATDSPFYYPLNEQLIFSVQGLGNGAMIGLSSLAAATGAAWAQAIPRSYITLPNGVLLETTLLTRWAAGLAPIAITNTTIVGGEVAVLGGDVSDLGRAMTMAAEFTVFYGSLFGTLNMLPNLRGAQGYLQGPGGTYRYSVAYREPSVWGLPPEQIASRAWKVPRALPAASGRVPITDAVPPTHRPLLTVGDWAGQVTLPRGFPPYLLSNHPVLPGSSSVQPSVTALATAGGPKMPPSPGRGDRLNLAGVEDSSGGGVASISSTAVIVQAKMLAPTNPLAALSILEGAIPLLAEGGDTRGAIACLTAMEEIAQRVRINTLELFKVTSHLAIYNRRLGRTIPVTLLDFRLEPNKENLPEVLYHMAWVYDTLGQVESAEQTREMIRRLGSQSPAAADSGGVQTYIDEARARVSWGNASGALSYLGDVIPSLIEVRRRDDAITCLAEAEQILRKVTDLQDVDVGVALQLAGLSKHLGKTGMASSILSKILKHISTAHAGTGHYDDVLYGIATTYAELGQIGDAKNTSARIDDRYLRCSTYLEIVETLLQRNQVVEATGVLEIVEPIVQGLSDSGPDLFVIADQLDLVADLLKGKGRPKLAERIRQLAKEIRDKG